MGNQLLRPNQLEPFAGFSDDQLGYLKEKFELLCDEKNLLSVQKIAQELQMTVQEAHRVVAYIDFDGHEEVDFYQFVCAAASLHQDDAEAREFIFEIYGSGRELDQHSLSLFFATVFKYLKFLNKIDETYSEDIGAAKFKKYDYNNNGTISLQEFESILKSDNECSMWMQALGFCEEAARQMEEKPQNHEIANENEFEVESTEGDQFTSTPAWVKVCEQMAPIGYEQPPNKTPNAHLDINHVYGYRSYDTRSNLKYSSTGEVLYHTAGCGIALHKGKNTMRVNTTHNDDITCLDAHPAKNIVATGEMGRKPALVIWDAITMQSKQVFVGKLQRSIAAVCLSRSGRFVAASSMSDTHDIAVYDVNNGSLVAFGRGPRSVIFALKFNASEDEIVCACQKEVVFARISNGSIQLRKGIFGKVPLEAALSIALMGEDIITSSNTGLLIKWKGNSASKVFKEHSKSVDALCERADGGLISGDSQGKIIMWGSNMTKEKELSIVKMLHPIKSNNPKIIALSEQNGNILVGTRGGQIIEISKGTAVVLAEGHFDKELWGLSVSGNRPQFYSGGEDKLLIKWDMMKRKPALKKRMDYGIKALDLSRNNTLAVGMNNGVVQLVDTSTFNSLKRITKHKNPDKQVLSSLKFSPDGCILAIGYCPPISRVHLYDVNGLNKIGECKGAATRIFSIDFSTAGDSLLATSDEPLFYKTSNGGQITAVSSVKNEQWATMTSRLTWFSRGIWPPCSDGSDVNSVDRSNSKRYLATADDFSKVKLFNYPVCIPRQQYNQYKGHSSHVTGVKWSFDDKFCISIGGLEKSIIQWTVDQQQEIHYEIDHEEQKQESEKDVEEYEYEGEPEKEKEGGNKEKEEGEIGMEEQGGDQAMAIKPFEGQVRAMTPPGYQPTHTNQPPPHQLTVKQVWGIRNQYIDDKVRNQLRYGADGTSCFFITAALGVEMNLKSKAQSFYGGQSDDLICFAMTRNRKYCATGQMAELNKDKPLEKIVQVHVWDAERKQLVAKLSRFHKRAVVLVSFSPSGKKLLTVGQDDKNSLAVYDWEAGRIAWSAPVDGAKVTAAAWKSESEYATVGLKHIKFWTEGKGVMGKVPGKWEPMLSIVYWHTRFVSSSSAGALYLWTGTTSTALRAHDAPVHCLAVDPKDNLISACSKGLIILWRLSANKLVQDRRLFQMNNIDRLDGGVLSLDFFENRMVVCTNSSSIHEVDLSESKGKTIMEAHCKGESWAECWSPDRVHFATAGDDSTVRIYGTESSDMVFLYKTKDKVRGMDWEQSEGKLIVAGDYKGRLLLFDTSLQLLCETKTRFTKTKPRQEPFWIQDVKFSPNGSYVAFGAHGGASHIEIYEVREGRLDNQRIIDSIFSSALLSIDWSQGSDLLMGVSQAYELQFMTLDGKVSASSVRNVKWATWSAKFGFGVNEIHQHVDYSKLNAVCLSPTRTLLATGTDDQKVRLFTYPVTIPKQKSKAFTAHSSHVCRVLFSKDQKHLLSIGGNDRTTILWKVNGPQPSSQPQAQQVEQKEQEGEYDEDIDEVEVPMVKSSASKEGARTEADDFGVDQDQGDQFMAVKPWLGAIKQPLRPYYKSSGKAPRAQLTLEYAHGYRVKDCRNNLKYLDAQHIVYHTAGVGVVMETGSRQQLFFDRHTDDIISMAVSEDRSCVYTSEMGARPIVYKWTPNGQKIKAYRGAKKGVSALAVNHNYLVAAALDDNHYLFLFDQHKETLLASEKGGRDVILALKWLGENSFVSVGLKHFRTWEFSGKGLTGKTGVFGKNCNLLCCVEAIGEKVWTGAANGELQVWSGSSCVKGIKAHKGAINAITTHKSVLITGANDSTVSIWDADSLNPLSTINCATMLTKSVDPRIRAVDAIANKLIVGTFGSEIYELRCSEAISSATSESTFSVKLNLMNGHYAPNSVTNQVWGLSLFGRDYVTCGDDGTVRVWDSKRHEQTACILLGSSKRGLVKGQLSDSLKGRCIAVSQSNFMLIGCKDGTVRLLDTKMREMKSEKVSKKEISHIKFSPDESMVAVGAHDQLIYLFGWSEEGGLKGRGWCKGHSSYIKHFDFSRDGNYLHSTCGAYELLFWNVSTGKQITSGASETRDEEWATWNVTLGWPVQGIWEPFMDGTDINAVDRSHTGPENGMRLLASGDDRGKVRLLEYPCIVKNSLSLSGNGHSSHVTNVRFSQDDTYLFSSGGEDQTILQWSVKM